MAATDPTIASFMRHCTTRSPYNSTDALKDGVTMPTEGGRDPASAASRKAFSRAIKAGSFATETLVPRDTSPRSK